jgi:tetratricopeptide (TPR) repeat protein
MRESKSACYKPWRWLMFGLLIVLVIGTASCDLVFETSGENINALIETWWGIDVSSPGQVALMIMAAGNKKTGNKEAFNGLTAYAHCRSEIYQERGDKLFYEGDIAGARAEYERAIVWGTTNSPHRAHDKATVYYRIANTYTEDAANSASMFEPWPLYRTAGQNMLSAAKTEPDNRFKAYYYRQAALNFARGGDIASGKKSFRQAVPLEPDNLFPSGPYPFLATK